MPSYLVKVKKGTDSNFYCVWSTVTDSPHFWGTGWDVAEYLMRDMKRSHPISYILQSTAERFARADLEGTSAMDLDYSWDDKYLMYQQDGLLPREKLEKFLWSFNGQEFDLSMLEPFEDA